MLGKCSMKWIQMRLFALALTLQIIINLFIKATQVFITRTFWIFEKFDFFKNALLSISIGGPLILHKDGKVIGLMSLVQYFSVKDRRPKFQVFTNIPFYYQWIESQSGLKLPLSNWILGGKNQGEGPRYLHLSTAFNFALYSTIYNKTCCSRCYS